MDTSAKISQILIELQKELAPTQSRKVDHFHSLWCAHMDSWLEEGSPQCKAHSLVVHKQLQKMKIQAVGTIYQH